MFKNSAPLFLVAVHSILHFFKSSLHIVIQSVIYSVITFHESGTNKIPVPMGTWVKCSSGRKQWWNVTHLSTVLKYKFQVLFFLVLPILVFPLYAYLLILHDISGVHFFLKTFYSTTVLVTCYFTDSNFHTFPVKPMSLIECDALL